MTVGIERGLVIACSGRMAADVPAVLLVGESCPDLVWVARRLRARGYAVFCADDLDQAANLVRSGPSKRLVFVDLAEPRMSLAELSIEIARRLPGWSVQAHEPFDDDDVEVSANELARSSN